MSSKKHKVSNAARELRLSVPRQRFEIRKNADGSRSISGYAATFGDLSQDLGGFKERIQKGAFSQSLKSDNPDVLCLYSHDDSQILGRVSSGTLKVVEDDNGLRFTCKLPDTSTARDLIALMERDDISQMSFGFYAIKDDWSSVNGQTIRTLIQVLLYEISVVGMPACTSTSVNLRSAPASIRRQLKRTIGDPQIDPSVDPDDDTDDDDEDGCGCDCDACEEDDRCEECSADSCDDESCRDAGCPAQAETETLRLRLRLAQHRARKF